MTRPRPQVGVEDRPDDQASAHFVAMDIALARGDYAAAARAQQSLAELGWEIRRSHPRVRRETEGVGR